MVRPSSVTIVTVSYAFLIVFDGSRIASTISDVGDILTDRRQVRAERWHGAAVFTEVAPGAHEGRLIEDQSTAASITQAAGIAGQYGRVFPAEFRLQKSRRNRRRNVRPDPRSARQPGGSKTRGGSSGQLVPPEVELSRLPRWRRL